MVILSGQEMNGEQIIPPITDPLGKHWQQPHRRFIELDDTHALMSEQTFKGLKEYSTSIPTGRYESKMWKGFIKGEWYLVWLAPDTIMNLSLNGYALDFTSVNRNINKRN